MTESEKLLRLLDDAGVEFIVIGGVAAIFLGAARVTLDLDIVYERSPQNLDRLVAALAPLSPYPRGAPPGLPFRWDVRTLAAGLNFTLVTELGDLDVLGEVAGGTYASLVAESIWIEAEGFRFRCVNLPNLIRLKRAAGRPKDFEAIAELEALLAETKQSDSGEGPA